MKKSTNKFSVALVTLFSLFWVNSSFANLEQELAAVAAAEAQGQHEEALAAKKARQKAAAIAAERRRKEEAKAAELARLKERDYQERLQDKRRDQSYDDELRKLELERIRLQLEKERKLALELEVEERKIALEREKARLKREDDFIDQELKREAAKTDVIQSEADATRSISRGAESLMSKEGDARIKKESGLFK